MKGNVLNYDSLDELVDENGFIFNSFNSSTNYFVNQLESIDNINFELFYGKTKPRPTKKVDYLNICSTLIKDIKNENFEKVILSRIKSINTSTHPLTIFENLNTHYKNTFNYIISIEGEGCWIGATPELLLDINNNTCETVSIAGTKSKDVQNWGEKEIEEQQFVTDFIFTQLELHLNNIKMAGPETIRAGVVEHLKTEFSGVFKQSKDWKNLLYGLHPTPATCGIPKVKSQNHIELIEQHERKFYTGFLGPVSKLKKQLFVNLRCMEIQDGIAYLYLGGGITSKSNAEEEWMETENKATTLIKAIN